MLACSIIVLTVFVHCATACTVYAGTSDGRLAISKDGGVTWSTMLSSATRIYSVSANGNNVYAGAKSGLYVSHNGGATWSIKNLQPNSACDSTVVSVFVDEQKRVYALIGQPDGCGRIAVSWDNGSTWPINFPSPFAHNSANDIYVDGPRIYVASWVGLGFSDDMGSTWTFKDGSSGLGSDNVNRVIGKGQSIYVGLNTDGGGASISKDGGRSWKTKRLTGHNIFESAIYLQNDTLYLATNGGGLLWSNDTTWTRKTTVDGLASNRVNAISGSGNSLCVGTDRGLSMSRDKGQTWITITTDDGLPSNDIDAVFVQCT